MEDAEQTINDLKTELKQHEDELKEVTDEENTGDQDTEDALTDGESQDTSTDGEEPGMGPELSINPIYWSR